jgi:hypothetical protein
LRVILILLLITIITLLPSAGVAQAADYNFTVDRNISEVRIKKDGSADIEYWITFSVDRGAKAIDVVDIGMPNEYFSLSTVTADIDGYSISNIRSSPYVTYGFAVYLGSHSIPAGGTGTLHIKANSRRMVYPDTDDSSYASVEFSPTWFGSEYTHGSTYLQVSIYFPPGVGPDETRYHGTQFTEARQEGDTPVMTWIDSGARPDRQYMFGVSFPRKYVDIVYTATATSTTTSTSTGGGSFFWDIIPFLIFGGFFIFIIMSHLIASARRKMAYLPPEMKVEGVEVKYGLNPVEAAIITETPLPRVLSMILFSVVKKGLVQVVSTDPLKLKVLEENLPSIDGSQTPREFIFTSDGSYTEVVHPAGEKSGLSPVNDYEAAFVKAIDDSGRLVQSDLEELLVNLIRSVQRKMKGFAAKPTAAYYKDIVAKALQEVTDADTPEVIAENMEWAMLDNDFEKKIASNPESQHLNLMPWFWALVGYSSLPGMPPGSLAGGALTNFNSMQGIGQIFNTLIRMITPYPTSLIRSVSRQTNPIPVTSGRSSGGSSCACACACAGCACACAGGGR